MTKNGEFRCGTCDVLLFGWQGNLTLGTTEIRATCPKCGEERVFSTQPSSGSRPRFLSKPADHLRRIE